MALLAVQWIVNNELGVISAIKPVQITCYIYIWHRGKFNAVDVILSTYRASEHGTSSSSSSVWSGLFKDDGERERLDIIHVWCSRRLQRRRHHQQRQRERAWHLLLLLLINWNMVYLKTNDERKRLDNLWGQAWPKQPDEDLIDIVCRFDLRGGFNVVKKTPSWEISK